MKYTPPIEFTLVAHDVVKGLHLESGPTALALCDADGWRAWQAFGHTVNELFGDLRLSWGLAVSEVVIDDDYAHFKFTCDDVNNYTVIPAMDMSVYIGDKYANVASYVQWSHIQFIVGDESAYTFGMRAKKVQG